MRKNSFKNIDKKNELLTGQITQSPRWTTRIYILCIHTLGSLLYKTRLIMFDFTGFSEHISTLKLYLDKSCAGVKMFEETVTYFCRAAFLAVLRVVLGLTRFRLQSLL